MHDRKMPDVNAVLGGVERMPPELIRPPTETRPSGAKVGQGPRPLAITSIVEDKQLPGGLNRRVSPQLRRVWPAISGNAHPFVVEAEPVEATLNDVANDG